MQHYLIQSNPIQDTALMRPRVQTLSSVVSCIGDALGMVGISFSFMLSLGHETLGRLQGPKTSNSFNSSSINVVHTLIFSSHSVKLLCCGHDS